MITAVKTLKGTKFERYKGIVGKRVNSQLYFHKDYVDKIIKPQFYKTMLKAMLKRVPGFKFNCLMIDIKTGVLRFDEAPDFDTAREPHVGNYVTVNPVDLSDVRQGKSNNIWHHKWLWVMDDYKGFDVDKSKLWSKLWLSKVPEVAKGTDKSWEEQLRKYGIL